MDELSLHQQHVRQEGVACRQQLALDQPADLQPRGHQPAADGRSRFHLPLLRIIALAASMERRGIVQAPPYFSSLCPPNCSRMAESSFSPKVWSWRERKRA